MTPETQAPQTKAPGRLYRAWDSDLAYAFRTAPVAIVATLVVLVVVFVQANIFHFHYLIHFRNCFYISFEFGACFCVSV